MNKQENNKSFDLGKYETKKLSEIAQLKRGPFGGAVKKEIFVEKGENTYQVYEQYNAIRNDINRGRYFINEKDYQRLKGFTLESGDIIMSCSGTVGKLATMPKTFYPGIINQALLRIRLNKDINNKYFNIIFKIIIEELISGNEFAYGGVIKNIASVAELKNIDIPLPPIKIQNEIVEIMENALSVKENKEKESKELFDNIDDFVLGELGIKYEEIKDDIITSTHTTKLNEYNRFDPYFFQDKFNTYEGLIEKTNAVELSECTSFLNTGNTPAKSMYTEEKEEGGMSIIKAGSNNGNNLINLDKVDYIKGGYNGTYAKQDDIYILASAHQAEYVGKKIYLLSDELKEDTFFVGELLCIRANPEVCNPYYLFSLLDTDLFKLLINRQKRGQTSHIYAKDIKKIKIPLPSLEIQETIAIEVKARIEKANILKAEAIKVYEGAKKKVEKMILGDV